MDTLKKRRRTASDPDTQTLHAEVPDSDLLHPRKVQMDYRNDPQLSQWFEELNDLGKHWICGSVDTAPPAEDESPGTHLGFGKRFQQEKDPRRRALLEQAWVLTYAALWANGTKFFVNHSDIDSVINRAIGYLMSDIMRYDPSKGPLGDMISSQLSKRISDSLRHMRGPRNHEEFSDKLDDIQNAWPIHRAVSEEKVEELIDLLFSFYYKEVERKLNTEEKRLSEKDYLRELLHGFDPVNQKLSSVVRLWVDERLNGHIIDHHTVSTDTLLDTDGRTRVIDLIESNVAVDEEAEQKAMTDTALRELAQVLNFKAHQSPTCMDNEFYRNQRICYTEKIVCLIQQYRTPNFNQHDMLRALLDSYLRHFLDLPEGERSFDLKTTPIKPLEYFKNPDSPPETWRTPTEWSSKDFLPAIVPISYLERYFHLKTTDSAVTKFRKSFNQSLWKALEDLDSLKESFEIKEPT